MADARRPTMLRLNITPNLSGLIWPAMRAQRRLAGITTAGFMLAAIAGCAMVPLEDLEAEQQQRQLVEARHQQLLQELRRQHGILESLEDRLDEESQRYDMLLVVQQRLEIELQAEIIAHDQLIEDFGEEIQFRQKSEQREAELEKNLKEQVAEGQALTQVREQLETELKQKVAASKSLADELARLQRELEAENHKRQQWALWQEQLERDRAEQLAVGDVNAIATYPETQLAAEGLDMENWQGLQEHGQARGANSRQLLEYNDANLYLLLLEKKAYISRLNDQIQLVILEVVRAKARLQSLDSKAEAASNLSEAEIAVATLRRNGEGVQGDPGFVKAEELTQMSAREYEEGNYGGALYLTGQAKSLLDNARARSLDQATSPVEDGEVPFVLPLTLKLLKQSDVMSGPGANFDVMFSLNSGSRLVGHSFKGQWVRVNSEDGRGGWIFYKAVGSI